MAYKKEGFNLCLGSDLAVYCGPGRVRADAERLDTADVPASAASSVESWFSVVHVVFPGRLEVSKGSKC